MASLAPTPVPSRSQTAPAAKPGLLAEMLRLWAAHNRRLLELGVQPL
ncbi:hypothetical protein OPKNFCMD_3033 [Methylobacterium crusticola]|uniref:MarR family transcriptional regulator n=1 Tax=Methylobacterium crusticola TaxID=1697972 RepID=A0ABQ4QYJ7_9HYPH|nr:hypothetical protein [Methylobacterium crusticola]GJD50294.1 hypothetical protein OPKNFCMD_3033 [Methylobacterium crusticola]